MPDEVKKNQNKSKQDSKEQRKPRQRKQEPNKKIEKKSVEHKEPEKPVYQEPGPEFYKNLKRETDEILKITEEANSKYKKKEIQSNWSKYEMPIESYEEIEEQENMGADYEKLIEAPLSIGGHFQFKHEKSWDLTSTPSLYDKYFDIDMDNLATALCTIPFYERNSIEESIFIEGDILTMESRATRYKQKYYNDKSYCTGELEAQDKLSRLLKYSDNERQVTLETTEHVDISESPRSELEDSHVALEDASTTIPNKPEPIKNIHLNELKNELVEISRIVEKQQNKDYVESPEIQTELLCHDKSSAVVSESVSQNAIELAEMKTQVEINKVSSAETVSIVNNEKERKINPLIESPADLEKWLDDFLED